jgi:hypothetical protein
VRLLALGERCPHFEEPLRYQVLSPVSVDDFRIFVAALEGKPSVVTTENITDLLLLCKEFGFTSLLAQFSDFISGDSVVDSEAGKHISDLETKIRQ